MDDSFFTGDSRDYLITVNDPNNLPIPLTGATITWALISQGTVILSKSVGSGITITNASAGQFDVSLTVADTKPLAAGSYQHVARVTTSDSKSAIVLTGTITITKGLI